jgi:glutathione peroxidase
LNALNERYGNKNFEILAFPSNQFANQEPGVNADEIMNGIKHVRPGGGFEPNFLMFTKEDVNGPKARPMYKFLKGRCPPPQRAFSPRHIMSWDPLHGDDIRWNFEKFLIDENGKPLTRYAKFVDPIDMVPHIDMLLATMAVN